MSERDVLPLSQPAGHTSCRLELTGLDCADCAKTLATSLSALPGVTGAQVRFPEGVAEIAYDARTLQHGAIVERVRALGYDVREPRSRQSTWTFDVQGMDCQDCARTVEAGVRRLLGVAEATVNLPAGTLIVTPGHAGVTPEAIIGAVSQAGYTARLRGAATASGSWWRKRRIAELAVAALLWLAGLGLERATSTAVYVVPFLGTMVIAGYPVARAGWFALRARRADMNVLMTLAAIGAMAIGKWEEAGSVLILFGVGLMLQTLTTERTRRAIQELMHLAPAEATVRRQGQDHAVPISEVQVGDVIIVRPGERIPVDGVVIRGRSAVDQSPITGESIPVDRGLEAPVFAGSINGDGLLEIRATTLATDTMLARIIHLVEEAQASRAPAQAFVDRFAALYTPAVVGGAVLLATAVPLVAGDFREWFFRALVLLVVACPCALVISTPVALVSAIGSASRRGILFKGGMAIEALAKVQAVVFDKTGTLTTGRPVVTDIVPLGAVSAEEMLARAAAVESASSHPVAQGIVRAARERDLSIPAVLDAEALPGQGARGVVRGVEVLVGAPRLFAALPAHIQEIIARLVRDGKTVVLVARDREIEGVIALADAPRPVAARAMTAVHALGLRTVMLTGDNRPAAERVAKLVGVTDVRADLLPGEKRDAVVALEQTAPVAMVGDGVNDGPALAAASVGIAMGAVGTGVAIEAADVVLMSDDLTQVPLAVSLARKTLAIIRQNIAASLIIKAVFLGLTVMGGTNLWLAVLADEGTALLVTANALRLLRVPASVPALHAAMPAPLVQPSGDD